MVTLAAGVVALAFALVLALTYAQTPRHPILVSGTPDAEAIVGWMTLHYISRAYGVPEPVLLQALNLTPDQAHHQSLDQLARLKQQSPAATIQTIRTAVRQYQARPPTGTPVSTPTPTAQSPGF